ncbi:hypothetical protein Tel_07335 [Candidatus Tenderia electrophaga]|jgi:hypothetical protein|uniref:DUF2232 domain-containing protein n=1 Tax=Candidatus Tenderia electrophaga TaxID=1748243 RepID=A0A0S2TCW1_9GAMM|nr:hypothetical protein Tel_07335 [Candidatus Tenderia electrophaga]
MRGPLQAMLVTAALALVSLVPILGVVSMLSGAALALVTLRHGARQGITVLLGAGVITGVFMYFVFGAMALGFVFLLLWLPLLLLALVLRSSASWSIVIDAATALGLAGIVVFYLLTGDPVQFWQNVLSQMVELMSAQGGGMEGMETIQNQLPMFSRWLTGMLAGALVMGQILSLMVGRWWQALLYNPGGFRQEFLELRQSRLAAMVLLAILVLSLPDLGGVSDMAGDMMIVMVTVYSIVGLALVHALVDRTGRHVGWLVALYLFLFILPPQAMLLLASAGFADSWVNFRRRLSSLQQKSDDDRNDNQ